MNEDKTQDHQINNLVTEQEKKNMDRPNENTGVHLQGHIKIWDPQSNEIYVNKRNAIHYENMSIALANGIANRGNEYIYDPITFRIVGEEKFMNVFTNGGVF